jgi:hypothetical protein
MQGWIEVSPGVFVAPGVAAAAGAGSVNRQRTQAEIDALARQQAALQQAEERKRIAADQVSQREQLQTQVAAQSAANAALALTQQQTFESEKASIAETQKKNLAAGQAVASSLRILSDRQGTQGRTAAVSRRGRRRGAPKATVSALRIGNTGRGYGSGNNLSI